jgi:hypothetical protein
MAGNESSTQGLKFILGDVQDAKVEDLNPIKRGLASVAVNA